MKPSPLICTLLLCALLLCAFPAPALASPVKSVTWLVNSNAYSPDKLPGDGLCADAVGKCSLRAAVDEANALGAGGPVDITINLPRGEVFNILSNTKPLEITADTVYIQSVDGEGTPAVIQGESGRSIVVSHGTLSLYDLTVSNGGGITVNGADSTLTLHTVTLQNLSVTYTNPTSNQGGGAVQVNSGHLGITNSWLVGNSTNANGGAILNNRGTVTIDASTLSSNSGLNGGAVFNISDFDGELHIWGSILESNVATNQGGALYLNGYNHQAAQGSSSVHIQDSRIRANQAASGGGIYVGKRYTEGDASMYTYGGMNLTYSEVSANIAVSGNGGGIYINNGTSATDTARIYAENSTLSGNEAFLHGGGIYVEADPDSHTYFYNTTITDNAADRLGTQAKNGGGYFNAAGSILHLENSILAANRDLSSGSLAIWVPDCVGKLDLQYSLLGIKQGIFCTLEAGSTGHLFGNGALLDANLGPRTENAITPAWYHPLQEDSPAVEAGDPAGCTGIGGRALTDDQAYGSRPRGLHCDMGARESPYTVPEIPVYEFYLPSVMR